MDKQVISLGRVVRFNRVVEGNVVQETALCVARHSDTCGNFVVWNSGGTSRSELTIEQGDGDRQWSWPTRA